MCQNNEVCRRQEQGMKEIFLNQEDKQSWAALVNLDIYFAQSNVTRHRALRSTSFETFLKNPSFPKL